MTFMRVGSPVEARAKGQLVDGTGRPPSGLGKRLLVISLQVLFFGGFVGLWEWGSRAGVLERVFYSAPGLIADQLITWSTQGTIVQDVLTTLQETILGFIIGTVLGLVSGFIIARSQLMGQVFEPALVILNAMPKIVLAPLFFLWFGIALASKVAFSASLVLFIVFFSTLAGIREVDENYISNSLVLGAKERDLTIHVLIPAALTWIFTSLRTSLGMALAGAVVAEYLGSTGGIGYRIAFAQATYDSTGVFAGLVVLTVIVIILDYLIQKVEQRFSVWKPPRGQT